MYVIETFVSHNVNICSRSSKIMKRPSLIFYDYPFIYSVVDLVGGTVKIEKN